MNSSIKACVVFATALWIGLAVAAFTGAPETATGTGWQPSKSSRLVDRPPGPEPSRRELAHSDP